MTAGQTATTTATPFGSAGLGVANLLVGGLYDDYKSVVFAEKTFAAVRSTIEAERAKIKKEIIDRKSLDVAKYSMQSALSDIDRLARASSSQTGISKLAADAEKNKVDAEGLLSAGVKGDTGDKADDANDQSPTDKPAE